MSILHNITEEGLYILLRDNYMKDLVITSKDAYTDAYSPLFNINVKIKCRHTHNDNLGIERLKWNILKKIQNIRYINSTPKGIYVFNIQLIEEPKWEMRVMPKSTDAKKMDYELKEVGYININLGMDITNLII